MAEARKAQARWLGFAGIGFAVLALIFGIWLTQAAGRVVGFDTHRNEHDLGIIAEGLASWPRTAASMARSNFIPQRLEPADSAAQANGWQLQARFWHPELGRFTIRYAAVAGTEACPEADADGRRAWFTGRRLHLRGVHDLALLEAADRHVMPGIGDWRAWLGTARPGRAGFTLAPGTQLCWATALPLDPLVHLDTAAPRVANLLLADAQGRVTAQLGVDPLPIGSLSQLRAAEPISASMLSALKGAPKAEAPRSLDPLTPVRVRIGTADYDAYVRDIVPGGVAGGDAQARAVALVPVRGLSARIPRAPIIIAGFSIPLLMLLALTAVIKLRLIGPGEAMARLEIAALAVGLSGAVALSTAAVLFAADVQTSRARAGIRTADTALELRRQFAAEVAPLLGVEGGRDRRGRWRDPATCIDQPLALASTRQPPAAGYALNERRRDDFKGRILPPRESAFVIGADGVQLPGTVISACRFNNGARLDVSMRDYFTKALEGDTFPLPAAAPLGWRRLAVPGQRDAPLLVSPTYTIEQVRSQSDGIDKTLIAWPAIASPEAREAGEPDAVVVSAAVLRSLLAPVLPPTESFMVIDLSSPGLEVIFHSERQRVHVEAARRELRSLKLDGIVARLRDPRAATEGPPALTSTYDGARQHFGLARLPHAPWAVLTWHSHDSADAVPAQVLFASLMSFSVFAAAFWAVPLIALTVSARVRWAWLWPDARRTRHYARLAGALALVAGVGVLALLLWPRVAVGVALACWIASVAAWVIVWRRPEAAPGPLRPDTARRYARAAAAALLALVAVPMAAFHTDASHFGRRSLDTEAAQQLEAGLAARAAATGAIANVYYSDLRGARQRVLKPSDRIGVAAGCWQPLAPGEAYTGWSQWLFKGLYHGPSPRAASVTPALAALACPGTQLAIGSLATYAEPDLVWESGSLMRVAWVALVLVLGLAVCGAALTFVLRRLFGLKTPLEAVTYPPLDLSDDFARLALPPKVMIVRPPLGLRQQLFDHGHRVDLSDERLDLTPGPRVGAAWEAPRHYVLYNLELTLREPERRREALRFAEKLADSPAVRNGAATLVLIAELTPLERLLQAYEQEKLAAADDDGLRLEAIRRQREDIRWSKLLEDFQTYIFGPVDKLLRDAVPGESAVETAVVRELAGLPEQVIATLLPPGDVPPVATTLRTPAEYDAVYRPPVTAFARSLHAASAQAAVDFVGLMLIEHYQQLWSASSRAEQLVMHNLALRRLPSTAARDAIRSLIRRGLVTYEPAPRLLNRSFASFILHAERPQTLQRWRAEQPRGGWRFAFWPLLIVLPLGLLALGGAILDSGQPLVALLPLLVAAGPALLQTLGIFRKAAT